MPKAGGSKVQGQPSYTVSHALRNPWLGGVLAVNHLPSMCKALGTTLSISKRTDTKATLDKRWIRNFQKASIFKRHCKPQELSVWSIC